MKFSNKCRFCKRNSVTRWFGAGKYYPVWFMCEHCGYIKQWTMRDLNRLRKQNEATKNGLL